MSKNKSMHLFLVNIELQFSIIKTNVQIVYHFPLVNTQGNTENSKGLEILLGMFRSNNHAWF